jgi:hypothetical protein
LRDARKPAGEQSAHADVAGSWCARACNYGQARSAAAGREIRWPFSRLPVPGSDADCRGRPGAKEKIGSLGSCVKKKRFHSCNVLDSSPVERHLWHFTVERNDVKLQKEETVAAASPLPPKLVAKDWSELVQPKLNIAWLPADQVFLRVVQLPIVDRGELLSMLEFQLEKISPLPVPQILWSAEVLPSSAEKMQTAILCVVAREVVESFVGNIEQQNYQPDRLEVPQLNQVLSDGVREDGAWIYPGTGPDSDICTIAWWFGGTLHDLHVVRLPQPPETPEGAVPLNVAEFRAGFLQEHLLQVAWAGELEGWLTMPVKWHLVADDETAARWVPLLSRLAEESMDRHPALDRKGLAQFSARRATRDEPSANLLPVEFAARYRQQFIDRLWMRGLGAVVAIYLAGVVVFMVTLQVRNMQASRLTGEVAGIANTYTNVLRLRERVQVLQEQLNLKYAALDCFKVASELLPADFILINFQFSRGSTLTLTGTAPPGQEQKVIDFNDAMRSATINGEKLFKDVTPPTFPSRAAQQVVNWNFDCKLNVSDKIE